MTAPAYAHRAEHTLVTGAPAATLYGLVSDVTLWPAVFAPTVHVRHLDRGPGWERFRIWAVVNDQVRSWTSRRELDPDRRTVTFRQEHSEPPITAMGGRWSFRVLPDGRTEIVLEHGFDTDGSPGAVEWVTAALDRNSATELSSLAGVASLGDVVSSFSDTVRVPGGLAAAYAFVHRADLWAERLPHVDRVSLDERPGGVQMLAMSTRAPDGTVHETESIRVCHQDAWIAYKQRVTPALLLGHSGLWTFENRPDGTAVTSTHTMVLSPEGAETVLGPGTTLAEARDHARSALSRNSRATLELAASHARAEV